MKSQFRIRLSFCIGVITFLLLLFYFYTGCAHQRLYVRVDRPVSSADSASAIPISFERGLPYVEASINGKKIGLMLDTGAEGLTLGLRPEALRGMTLQDRGSAFTMRRTIYGASYVDSTFRLQDVRIGPIRYTDLLCYELLLPSPVKRGGGLIGMDVLKDYCAVIDYRSRRAVLYALNDRPPELDEEGWTVLPLGKSNSVEGALSDVERPIRIGFDTGATFFFKGKSYSIFRNKRLKRLYRNVVQGSFEAESHKLDYIEQTHVTVEGKRIEGLNVVFWDLPLPEGWDLILSHDFFSKYKVCMDYPNKKLFFRRY